MLTTWKIITQYTGYSRNTLKALMTNEGFPITYIAGRPATTKNQIEIWIASRITEKKNPQHTK